jgi:hypothetical protein
VTPQSWRLGISPGSGLQRTHIFPTAPRSPTAIVLWCPSMHRRAALPAWRSRWTSGRGRRRARSKGGARGGDGRGTTTLAGKAKLPMSSPVRHMRPVLRFSPAKCQQEQNEDPGEGMSEAMRGKCMDGNRTTAHTVASCWCAAAFFHPAFLVVRARLKRRGISSLA